MKLQTRKPPARIALLSPILAVGVMTACGGSDDSLAADAGKDISVAVGESPTFDGCGSKGSISNYKWVIVAAPDSMPEDVGKAIREESSSCKFVLEDTMTIGEAGTWRIELTVADGDSFDSDEVEITVTE